MSEHVSPSGWYGPPNSRRWHYIGPDGRSLCGKWFIFAWDESLIDRAYGPANGDCVGCKKKAPVKVGADLDMVRHG